MSAAELAMELDEAERDAYQALLKLEAEDAKQVTSAVCAAMPEEGNSKATAAPRVSRPMHSLHRACQEESDKRHG